MDNNQAHIDQLIKQKFDNFEAPPPEHIWAGIQAGIAVAPSSSFIALYGKRIAVAALFVIAVIAGLFFVFQDDSESIDKSIDQVIQQDLEDSPAQQQNQAQNTAGIIEDDNVIADSNSPTQNIVKENKTVNEQDSDYAVELTSDVVEVTSKESKESSKSAKGTQETSSASLSVKSEEKIPAINETAGTDSKSLVLTKTNEAPIEKQIEVESGLAIVDQKESNSDNNQEITNEKSKEANQESSTKLSENQIETTDVSSTDNPSAQSIDVTENLENGLIVPETDDSQLTIAKDAKPKTGLWSMGLYLSPEYVLNNFDSVSIEPAYSLGIEPTYSFNNHWFVRFGLGVSYARDKGYAKIDYTSNDFLGTYQEVVDITFDSIDGVVVPTFYTKTTEVWDTINHIGISELTNKYIYLQVPALFGYYNQSKKFKWYFYGGPAINFMVSEQIEEPMNGIDYLEIINLENNLPERSPYYLQLWIGAGIEYKVGKNLGIALEPNYRYYFDHVYKGSNYKNALSGFSLRFGLVYTFKERN